MTRLNTKATATAKIATKSLALIVVASLVSGCMGNPAGGQMNFQTVQTKQISDPNKGCSKLKAEIAGLEANIASIDGKIRGTRTQQSAFDMFSAFGGFANANQRSLATFGQSQAGNEVMRLENVKSSYQGRRDTLFRGYHSKGC